MHVAITGPREQRRYSAPSYELRRSDGAASASVPGFNPVEAYEAAVASIAPELARAPKPDSVSELLRWAGEPLERAPDEPRYRPVEALEPTGASP